MVVRLLPLLLLSGSLAAQLAGVAGIDVSDYSQLGYARPTVTGTIGAEWIAPTWEASIGTGYSPARKTEMSSGHSYGAGVSVTVKILGPVLAGVCYSYSYTHSPFWSKWNARPCVFAGLDVPPWRVMVDHTFTGDDVSNGAVDNSLAIRYSIPHETTETRFGVHIGNHRFHASNQPAPLYDRWSCGVSAGETF